MAWTHDQMAAKAAAELKDGLVNVIKLALA